MPVIARDRMAKKIELWPIEKLRPYAQNSRTHDEAQVAKIAASMQEFGFTNPVLVDGNDGIIAGHGRVMAAKHLGLEQVPVIVLDHLTEPQRRAYVIADNRLAEHAGWDMDVLAAELDALTADGFDIELTGFSDGDLDAMLSGEFVDEPRSGSDAESGDGEDDADNGEESAGEDDGPKVTVVPPVEGQDEAPEPPALPVTCRGDVWLIGSHRLMCGDSTVITDVDKLLNGNVCDLVFTDPPYNVAFNGRSGSFDVIKNDNVSQIAFSEFLQDVATTIQTFGDVPIYIWCNWKCIGEFVRAFKYTAIIVWAKNVFGLGAGYRHQHEFCLFRGKIDADIKNESDLWSIAKDTKYVHPTQKPVALAERALSNHAEAMNIVDIFGGSGSTLVACEKMGRCAFVMELDEKYCDVIVRRMAKLFGIDAVLEVDGRTFAEVESHRVPVNDNGAEAAAA